MSQVELVLVVLMGGILGGTSVVILEAAKCHGSNNNWGIIRACEPDVVLKSLLLYVVLSLSCQPLGTQVEGG